MKSKIEEWRDKLTYKQTLRIIGIIEFIVFLLFSVVLIIINDFWTWLVCAAIIDIIVYAVCSIYFRLDEKKCNESSEGEDIIEFKIEKWRDKLSYEQITKIFAVLLVVDFVVAISIGIVFCIIRNWVDAIAFSLISIGMFNFIFLIAFKILKPFSRWLEMNEESFKNDEGQ